MPNPHPRAPNLTVVEDPNLVALCPHCGDALASVLARRLTTAGRPGPWFGTRYLYACPSCRKALGVSHRKSFWMG